eukprot:COSAG02_NODE_432_length_22440_cov_53.821315_12_plen_184_part_00
MTYPARKREGSHLRLRQGCACYPTLRLGSSTGAMDDIYSGKGSAVECDVLRETRLPVPRRRANGHTRRPGHRARVVLRRLLAQSFLVFTFNRLDKWVSRLGLLLLRALLRHVKFISPMRNFLKNADRDGDRDGSDHGLSLTQRTASERRVFIVGTDLFFLSLVYFINCNIKCSLSVVAGKYKS